MTDRVHRIELAEPFAAPERGRYQAALSPDGTWRIGPAANDYDGFPLERGDTVSAVHLETHRLEVARTGEPDGALILALPMRQNDAGAATVREYLLRLPTTVWDERGGFNGKRPWGNSGWEYDLHEALIRGGLIAAEVDSDGFVEDWGAVDKREAHRMIQAAIDALGTAHA